jgi:hypothetical protein
MAQRDISMFRYGLIVLTSLAAACLLWADADSKKPTSFMAVVSANFDKWDLNHDGKLTSDEINKLLSSHTITGEAAAALASIHVFQRGKKAGGPALSRDMLKHQAGKDDGDVGRRDKAQKAPHFENNYQSFRTHIAKAPRELFVGKAPSLTGFSQGNLGDCYFLSAVGAAVNRNPALIRRMFQPRPDGSVDLTFANGRHVHVTKLTDAEIAIGSSAGQQGLWLNVLEKGFGQVKIHTSRGVNRGEPGLDAIATGGDADDTISLLTGHKADMLTIRNGKGKEPPPPSGRELPILVTKLRALFRISNTAHPLLCAGTPGGKLPPGVVTDHDYAILGYDNATDTVHLWNPWGNQHKIKGPPGLQFGYAVDGGKFSMPLNEFVQIFEEVYYETALPPHVRGRK